MKHEQVETRYRVITPIGMAWVARFNSEEAAWGRLLALKGHRHDTPQARASLLRDGWKVREAEVTSEIAYAGM